MLDRLYALENFGIKLGLENITRLCEAFGHPERTFETLHVAGTNGKGSVTAMVHAALLAAGRHAARYTSPHLTELNERFVIGRDAVDQDTLEAVAADVLDCADRLRASGVLSAAPTFFEATTAMAFELFRRAGVEIAVIEVGLGGRFDATSVIHPAAGAITTIALDHQQHLGGTLEAIAFEKAGIIKPGMPVVAGALPRGAMEVVRAVAADRQAHFVEAAAGAEVAATMDDGRARLTIRTPLDTYGPLTLALRGAHQAANALVAVRLLEALGPQRRPPARAVEEGLSSAEWPARLELLQLADGRRVLIDAAHNEEGAAALADYLRQWHPERPTLVVGVMKDKDADDILRQLLAVTGDVICTAAPTPRAMPAAELARRAEACGGPGRRVDVADEPVEAVARALTATPTVCAAGSIVLAGVVRQALKARTIG